MYFSSLFFATIIVLNINTVCYCLCPKYKKWIKDILNGEE